MNKQETIADIIAEIRKSDCDEICPWWADGGSCDSCPLGGSGKNCSFSKFADRLEAAWKREKSEIEADALAAGGLVEASRATAEKSSVVGDAVAMREVVKELLDAMYDMGIDEETVSIAAESPNCHMHSVELLSVIKKAKAALAKPPRNCDVGTPEEQEERYAMFIKEHWTLGKTALQWAQMPYKEGGDYGNK